MSELTSIFTRTEDERYNVLKSFYTSENLAFKTDLTDTEIAFISLVEFFDETLKKDFGISLDIGRLTKLIKEHKVSKNRLGRSEAVAVLKATYEEEKPAESRIKRLLGL